MFNYEEYDEQVKPEENKLNFYTAFALYNAMFRY